MGCPKAHEPTAGDSILKSTNHRREKRERGAAVRDLPGGNPDPSLGGPHDEDPTTHHRDESLPTAVPAGLSPPGGVRQPDPRRVHGVRSYRNRCWPSDPCQAHHVIGGHRVHRGVALLLGVRIAFQISSSESGTRDLRKLPATWGLGYGAGRFPAITCGRFTRLPC